MYSAIYSEVIKAKSVLQAEILTIRKSVRVMEESDKPIGKITVYSLTEVVLTCRQVCSRIRFDAVRSRKGGNTSPGFTTTTDQRIDEILRNY